MTPREPSDFSFFVPMALIGLGLTAMLGVFVPMDHGFATWSLVAIPVGLIALSIATEARLGRRREPRA